MPLRKPFSRSSRISVLDTVHKLRKQLRSINAPSSLDWKEDTIKNRFRTWYKTFFEKFRPAFHSLQRVHSSSFFINSPSLPTKHTLISLIWTHYRERVIKKEKHGQGLLRHPRNPQDSWRWPDQKSLPQAGLEVSPRQGKIKAIPFIARSIEQVLFKQTP